jgi:light-regulated signal transduction histidine kinase (bacteriophytochrome)
MYIRDSLMKGWEAGADDYLFKPFHPRELESRVRSILSGLHWRRKSEAYRRQRDSLEHFTHIASHDLREPLRKIINFVQLFLANRKEPEPESEGYLRAISKSAMRMYKLLDSLIEYSRLEKEEPAREKKGLGVILEEVLKDLAPDLQAVQAEVSTGVLPDLEVHPSQIAVVFSNLIGNSLKYRREEHPPRIRVEARKNGFEWVITLSDNGIGFDPAQSDHIFIMFERLHGNEKYQGEGMGLAICRRIIENHGGRIWADSRPGQGSNFHFTLLEDREKIGSPIAG